MHVQKRLSFGRKKSLESTGNFQESGLWFGTVDKNQSNVFLMTFVFFIL